MNPLAPQVHSYSTCDERNLIEQCIDGNQDARTNLFYNYNEMVYRFVYRFVGPTVDINDIVQDTFVEILKSIHNFRGKSKLSTWIYRITLHICSKYIRRKQKRRNLFIPWEGCFDDKTINQVHNNADSNTLRRYRQIKLMEALSKISVKKRTVVVLYDIEGQTLEEISHIIKKPTGTVKSRLFHARAELRNFLEF